MIRKNLSFKQLNLKLRLQTVSTCNKITLRPYAETDC